MVDLNDLLSPQVAVLGSMLLEDKLVGPVLAAVDAADFTNERCRLIFQTISGLFREGTPADPAVVSGKLKGMAPDIGKDLLRIMEQTPTAANVWAYVDVLKEQSRLLALREMGESLKTAATLEDARETVSRMQTLLTRRRRVERMDAAAVFSSFGRRHEAGKAPDYIPWGLDKLDRGVKTEPGDFVILGGEPSAGKTALAIQLAWNMAKTRRVGFYSLETSTAKLSDRSVAMLAGIDMGSIKGGQLSQEQWNRFAARMGPDAARQIDFIPAAGFTPEDVESDALAHRYEVIFVDYLQLIRVTGRYLNRTEAVTSISLAFHRMSQSHGVTVVGLSQLNREGKAARKLDMSSLRESGQLEQDADAILLLYRKRSKKRPNLRGLYIAKNKEGETGEFFLDFDGKTQTITQSSYNPREETVQDDLIGKGQQIRQSQRAMTGEQMSFTELPADEPLPF